VSESPSSQDFDAGRDRLRAQAEASSSRPTFLTVPEVAELARCRDHKTVRKAIHDGLLPAFAPNRTLLIQESDAIAWIKSRPVRSTPRPARPPRSTRQRAAPGSVQTLREIERNLTR
jgi:hypothetical protein